MSGNGPLRGDVRVSGSKNATLALMAAALLGEGRTRLENVPRLRDVDTMLEWKLGWNGQRVMFPLDDAQGRTVGFTGRVLDNSKPKYKNSSNDAIYQKAEMIFGLDKARSEIVKMADAKGRDLANEELELLMEMLSVHVG